VKAGDRIVIDGTGKLRPGSKIVEGKVDTSPTAPIAETPARAQG
jgi:hypothetical protein